MGKRAPSAPPAPDPIATANAQGQANIEAARATANMNRVNQITPFGSITYSQPGGSVEDQVRAMVQANYDQWQAGTYRPNYGNDKFGAQIQEGWRGDIEEQNARNIVGRNGSGDRWEQRVTLDPRVQAVADRLLGTAGRSAGEGDRNRVEAALFDRMNPQLDRERETMETRLRNQGITPGSEAYSASQADFGRNVNDARLGVISQAGQEQDRAMRNRQQMMGELLSVLGMGPQSGGGGGGGVNVAPADVTSAYGMQQAANNQRWQGQVANVQSNNAAAASAVGAAAAIAAAIA